MTLARIEENIEVPQGAKARLSEGVLHIEGPKGKLERNVAVFNVDIRADDRRVTLLCERPNKREKSLIGTYAAHVRNMIRGVTEGFEYKMKIVYSHFPVRASVKEKKLVIENFLGERHPRSANIMGAAKVEVKGDVITITGADVEEVGQTAANIERATRIKGYDPRIFQDGIYITSKNDTA